MDPAQVIEREILRGLEPMTLEMKKGNSEIQKFYEGRVVFMTGVSGFVGKHLLEKLLRSCAISKMYILLRGKKDMTVRQRLNKLLKDPLYDGLHSSKPGFVNKLVIVEGDIAKMRLGISDVDWKVMANEVEVIFNVAATVNFTEKLKVATMTNVRGTREVLAFAKECTKLVCMVHMSTAFAHATKDRIRKDVLEICYKSPIDPDVLIDLVDSIDDKRLEGITDKLLEGWPNTYTFTKAVAEEAVRAASRDIPICIVKPSVVIGAYRDPLPGWIDPRAVYSASGLVFGAGMGVIHVLLSNSKCQNDLIPVDLVNNATIAAGWETGTRRNKDLKIYTVSSWRNPITWQETNDYLVDCRSTCPTPKAVWFGFAIHANCPWWFYILHIIYHLIPSCLADAVSYVIGKPLNTRKLLSTFYNLSVATSYFSRNEWNLRDDNTQALYQSMSPSDQIIYDYDVTKLKNTEVVKSWALGIRRYILKDKLQDTLYARKKQFWLRIAHYIFMSMYLIVVYCVFCGVSRMIRIFN